MGKRVRYNYKNLKIKMLGIEIVDDVYGIISELS